MAATQDHVARIHSGVLATASVVGEAVHALVRERIAAGTPPLDPFRGLHLDTTDVEWLLSRPILHDGDEQTKTAGRSFTLPRDAHGSPLDIARKELGLDLFETAVLALCLLPEIDARYGSLIGFLHDDVTRKQPSVELALALFVPNRRTSLEHLHVFAGDAHLRAWQLIQMPQEDVLIRQPIQLDRAFLWYLLGECGLDPDLSNVARILTAEYVSTVPVSPALATTVAESARPGTPALLYGEI